MEDDIRCCGTGTCLINAEGFCWCGQQWDGTQMCFPAKPGAAAPSTSDDFSKTTSVASPTSGNPT